MNMINTTANNLFQVGSSFLQNAYTGVTQNRSTLPLLATSLGLAILGSAAALKAKNEASKAFRNGDYFNSIIFTGTSITSAIASSVGSFASFDILSTSASLWSQFNFSLLKDTLDMHRLMGAACFEALLKVPSYLASLR